MEIGIIGFGRFGELLVKNLIDDFDVFVYDKEDKVSLIESFGAKPIGLKEICQKDIVIPSVPISNFKSVIEQIADKIKDGALVMDVCSVKEYPANCMKELLPTTVGILATHPMFGPDSAAKSVTGRKMVLCPIRIDDKLYSQVKEYLAGKQLHLIEMTAQEHDKQVAESQLLTHFVGRSLIEFCPENVEIGTEGYARLKNILGVVQNDSWQLFEDMNNYNRFAKQVRKRFLDAAEWVDKKVKKDRK